MNNVLALLSILTMATFFISNYDLGACWTWDYPRSFKGNLSLNTTHLKARRKLAYREISANRVDMFTSAAIFFSTLWIGLSSFFLIVLFVSSTGILDSFTSTIRDALTISLIVGVFLLSAARMFFPKKVLPPYWLKKANIRNK